MTMENLIFFIVPIFLSFEVFPQSAVTDGVHVRFENRKEKGYYSITQVGLLIGTRTEL